MRILTFLFLAVFLFGNAPLQAQDELSKEEKKELKDLAKRLRKNPLELKEMQEAADMYREQNEQLQAQITTLTSENQMMGTRVEQLEQNNAALNNQLATAQNALQEMANATPTEQARGNSNSGDMMMGTVFRVQIGAYEKSSISEDLDSSDGSMTLENANGMQKVMVGQFRDYQNAKELMQHMKKIGLRDAWVVAYVDGGRVDLNDVVAKDQQ
ncbi:SPOR domain-containing protein [Flavilitoribacter nigricans]|uniref:SPOR domain-containing protein n=1 Tax=Flavilitoribacter nigricans (strain ATCC 23147 / DSM 23189 / NBRC 102662 / NCIMB 1420 / SS-2) TaxID=1122177 RepID=A0A2D0N678_FLAN2|nr:SPOR domain-containing protein [Flavilitoribacter nigricans]PHN03283.1 hypothetical protein CRP01_28230 [Flavilitoribacter nigricans DSM 23189 = NBRC 102662]